MLKNVKKITESILKSYSVIFFADKLHLGLILLLISFLDPFAGLNGFVAILTVYFTAAMLGFDEYKIRKGFYTFNALLLGLGIGLDFEANWMVVLIVMFGSLLSFFLTVSFEKILGKYGLPYLSLPFLFCYWIVLISIRDFHFIGLSSRSMFFINDLYSIGGEKLLSVYNWWNSFNFLASINTYFVSLGAIFFQYKVIAGIIISLGLLFYSRIAFSLSLIGFYCAYVFYQFIGANISDTAFSYIGFNFILVAIAVGGYFFVPSRISFLWAVLLTPVTVFLTIGFVRFFSVWNLYIFSLPFNVTVLLFLLTLKSRLKISPFLTEVSLQKGSPENNLYTFINNNHRFKNISYFPVRLPFLGEWTVSQAHNGKITHKDKWRHAWDFVIKDLEGKTFKNYGSDLDDYYCFNKSIIAPADGFVDEIIDGIEDNRIGDVNLENNWGNTIIIRHGDYIYSKLSHLKNGSFKVVKGEWVKSGQVIASCGNSGRSPEPHLHFQMQSTPIPGGETIDFPIAYYITKVNSHHNFHFYERPELDDKLININVLPLMKNAFHLIPGKTFKFEYIKGKKKKIEEWEIVTDIYNSSYIYCKTTNSYAYFSEDGKVFYFYDFTGKKKSVLYYFFLSAYKVPLGYYPDINVKDSFAINLIYKKISLVVQDFIAPFFVFLKAEYSLEFNGVDDEINPAKLQFSSEISTYFFKKKTGTKRFGIEINRNGIESILIKLKKKNIQAVCIE